MVNASQVVHISDQAAKASLTLPSCLQSDLRQEWVTVTAGSSYPFWDDIFIYTYNGLSKPYRPFVKDSEPDTGF